MNGQFEGYNPMPYGYDERQPGQGSPFGFLGQLFGFPGQGQGQGQGPGFSPGPGIPRPPGQQPGFPPGPPPGQPGQGQGAGPPQSPPPQFTPQQGGQGGQFGVYAVDPGSIRGCLFRYTYVWLDNRQQFWFYPTFVGQRSISGYRWTGFFWVYYGVDLRRIDSFQCF
ncbi:hypothetical protein TMU01_23360 [Tenuibacillus multivorans]|nr:hypothetical protein [Tenuibacillus multivorans]GEL78101.1 hypothetical protein TMU01_23360 [Tenuibacillus multivorans]